MVLISSMSNLIGSQNHKMSSHINNSYLPTFEKPQIEHEMILSPMAAYWAAGAECIMAWGPRGHLGPRRGQGAEQTVMTMRIPLQLKMAHFFPAKPGRIFFLFIFFWKITKSECSVFYKRKHLKNRTVLSKSEWLASISMIIEYICMEKC